MALDIQQREADGIFVLELKGRITAGPEVAALRRRAMADSAGARKVVLDLAGVDYIDSTGLGALVMCATALRKAGGDVKLLNLDRRHIELLVMTKLATIFEIFNNERDAVNSYFPGRLVETFDILEFVRKLKKEEE